MFWPLWICGTNDVGQSSGSTKAPCILRSCDCNRAAGISSEWGVSENNRKARYYAITRSGRRKLARETENWERIAGVIGRVLQLAMEK